MKTIDGQEWIKKGTALYGPDRQKWKFKCPVCRNVQSGDDFIPYRAGGARVDMAYQRCIGQLNGHLENPSLPGCMFSTSSQPQAVQLQLEYGRGHLLPIMEFADE